MPKPRNKENIGLPKRWQHTHGAYYYQVPAGLESAWDGKKKFRLGSSLPEAYQTWAARIQSPANADTIGKLLDRYLIEVVPKKSKRTQVENNRAIANLRATFGAVALDDMKPQMVYQYVDKRKATPVAAHRAVDVLSHAFTKAVEWGLIDRHPFRKEVRLEGEAPRTRYVEDWELIEALSLSSKRKSGSVLMIQAYIRLKLLTGLRRGDLLRLTMSDLREDGIHVKPHKTKGSTGKKIIIERSLEVDAAIATAKAVRTATLSPWLFCTRKGECYIHAVKETASGWDSMWQRFMTRVLEETKMKERFTEHDLRAKCASDAETLEHARQLLAHADGRVTDRIYRRKPERVKPLR